jgi:hypothetical protein
MPILALIFGFFAATAALLAQVFFSLFLTAPLTNAPSLILLVGAATLEEGAKLAFLVQLGKRTTSAITSLHALFFGFIMRKRNCLYVCVLKIKRALRICGENLFLGQMKKAKHIGLTL